MAIQRRKTQKKADIADVLGGHLIPPEMIQPLNICQQLMDVCCIADEALAHTLTRLFYGIGSPGAFRDLSDACKAIRSKGAQLSRKSVINQTAAVLEFLDATDCMTKILRRLYLTRLSVLRSDRVRHLEIERSRRHTRSSSNQLARASTMALDDMVQTAYPTINAEIPLFAKKRRWVENKLRRGRNWHKMVDSLSQGILALIPSNGPSLCK